METHVKVLATLALVRGGLGLLVALFSSMIFGALASFVSAQPDEGAAIGATVLGITGVALTIYLVATAAVSIICGVGLWNRKRWARILGIVLGAMLLIEFPLGTALGIYALWVLFNKRTEPLFA